MINATLGLTYNIGKHESHLFWHDPLQEIYYKLDVLDNRNQDIEVCKKETLIMMEYVMTGIEN